MEIVYKPRTGALSSKNAMSNDWNTGSPVGTIASDPIEAVSSIISESPNFCIKRKVQLASEYKQNFLRYNFTRIP